MTFADALLPEFDQEMKTTRKYMERFPAEKADYKPHEKSMSMSRLASHVAEIPTWATATFAADELDMNPVGGTPMKPVIYATSDDLLAFFDKNAAEARAAIASASDAEHARGWSLKSAGQTYFTMPKGAVLRTWVYSHLIHHRAQLSVYYRLNDVPVPATYGPTADDSGR
jgi:uncharacterized damage-inducible protein DinB